MLYIAKVFFVEASFIENYDQEFSLKLNIT